MKSLISLLATVTLALHSFADPLDTWNWRNPAPFGTDVYGIAYANGLFVITGEFGMISTSLDATNWVRQNSGVNTGLGSPAYGNGLFVVANGTQFLTSPNGTNWTSHTAGVTNPIGGIAYSNGRFVATQAGNELFGNFVTNILISADATNWTLVGLPGYGSFHGVTFANGQFVAVGGDDAGEIITSTNGTEWIFRRAHVPPSLESVGYGNGMFVAAGYDYSTGTGQILASADGVTWSNQSPATTDYLHGVGFGNGEFVVGSSSGTTFRSANGLNWFGSTPLTRPNPIYDVGYGNGVFVGVGGRGGIYTSPLPGSWTTQSGFSVTSMALLGLTYAKGIYVAVGSFGTILTSSDGKTWAVQQLAAAPNFRAIAYGNGVFVAVGDTYNAFSPDAFHWTIVNTPFRITDVTFANGYFVSAPTAYSTDGTSWTAVPGGGEHIVFGHNTFITIDSFGHYYFSKTGTNFSPLAMTGIVSSPLSICYGNDLFLMIVGDGDVVRSPDGVNWNFVDLQSTVHYPLYLVTFLNGTFLIPSDGFFLTSKDGVTWTRHNSNFSNGVNAFAFGNRSAVTVGYNGFILQSGPFIDLQDVQLKAGGAVMFDVISPPGENFRIQSSLDLTTWSEALKVTFGQATNSFTDDTAKNSPARYYRVVSP